MISFRSSRKLSSYLVWARLYPLERTIVSFQCKGKWCQTCHNVKEADTFISKITGKTYMINCRLNCNDKCLVYFTCKVCLKENIGKTVDEFRYRWNNYKNSKSMQQLLFEHFSEEGHHSFLKDVQEKK